MSVYRDSLLCDTCPAETAVYVTSPEDKRRNAAGWGWTYIGGMDRCPKCSAAGGPPGRGLLAEEVLARVPGLTYRMLNHWTTRGYVAVVTDRDRPGGSGVPRHWTLGEVLVLQRVVAARAVGLEVGAAFRAARATGPVDLSPEGAPVTVRVEIV